MADEETGQTPEAPEQEQEVATETAPPPPGQEPLIDPPEPPASAPVTGEGQELDIEFLLDIPLTVRVEVGRTRMMINELLQLGQGSVIELSKLVGEPFEVMVNDKLVARGEIVVVNERFGVRLTDIISPMERIQTLA